MFDVLTYSALSILDLSSAVQLYLISVISKFSHMKLLKFPVL